MKTVVETLVKVLRIVFYTLFWAAPSAIIFKTKSFIGLGGGLYLIKKELKVERVAAFMALVYVGI